MGVEKIVQLTDEESKKLSRFACWNESGKDYQGCSTCASFCSSGACTTCTSSLDTGYFPKGKEVRE